MKDVLKKRTLIKKQLKNIHITKPQKTKAGIHTKNLPAGKVKK